MKSFTIAAAAALLAAGSVSAQDSVCPGLNILEACLETTQGYLSLCTNPSDYACLCDRWTTIMTCFANCPDDSRSSSFGNNKQLYCMNASIYAAATSGKAPGAVPTQLIPATTAGLGTPATTTTHGFHVALSTQAGGSTSTPPPAAAGARLAVGAGSLVAAVAGVVAAVL